MGLTILAAIPAANVDNLLRPSEDPLRNAYKVLEEIAQLRLLHESQQWPLRQQGFPIQCTAEHLQALMCMSAQVSIGLR